MTCTTRTALLGVLETLSGVYPEMRFGQLMEFVCLLANGNDSPQLLPDTTDEAMLTAARQHLDKRPWGSGEQFTELGPLPSARAKLLNALSLLSQPQFSLPLGHLILDSAEAAGKGVYDVEDEELLELLVREPVLGGGQS